MLLILYGDWSMLMMLEGYNGQHYILKINVKVTTKIIGLNWTKA